jgi:dipeptide/tripeptide permease
MRQTPAQNEGLLTQLKGFDKRFWIVNSMEMFERLAYYGLRTVIPTYMVLAYEEGGPQFSHVEKGSIFAWWALVQSFLPVFTGGYADRFGYKKLIAMAIAIKVAGYMLMAYAIDLAALFNGGSVAALGGAAGGSFTYPTFFAGAMLLAAGTAIFKPGVQGILATTMPPQRASMGWSIFYQLVNIGGFLGPMIAGYLRVLEWRYVFVACAIIVSLNYFLLLTFKDPEKKAGEGFGSAGFLKVFVDSIKGVFEPRLLAFTLLFAGFWLMFYQLFDILPNFIDDWVDSRGVLAFLDPVKGLLGFGDGWPAEWNGNLSQEYMINFNAGLISLFAFLVGYLTGRIHTLTSICIGILISAGGTYMIGTSPSGWTVLFAIGIFSLGEMMASPKKLEYLASIAPPGKAGLYMGYANATVGLGWSVGSKLAGGMYETGGDKVNLAKQHLLNVVKIDPNLLTDIKKTDVMPLLADKLGVDVAAAQKLLWDTYEPFQMWTVFAAVGLFSMVGLVIYDRVIRHLDAKKPPAAPAISLKK